MIVEQVSLANFHGLEQLDLRFAPGVNVIAGVNGIGKSSILQALAVLFSRVVPEFTPAATRPLSFAAEDVQHGRAALVASARFGVEDQHWHIGIQRERDDAHRGDRWMLLRAPAGNSQPAEAPPFAELLAGRTLTGLSETARTETERALHALRRRPNHPLVIYFSVRRQLPGKPKTLPKPAPYEVQSAYPFALEDREVTLREFMHWFYSQQVLPGRGATRSRRMRALDTLRAVIHAFVREFTDLRVETTPELRLVVDKAGTPLAVHQLSDGERGLLAILFDLTRRLAIANPELDDPIGQGRGIVMIDEIELHLHPCWQRQALQRFTDVFRGCQFIVTTHSPLVLGEVPPEGVRFLSKDSNGKTECWTPGRARGLDANRVLEELMGVPARDPKVERALRRLAVQINAERFDEARRQMRKLETLLGANDPELTRARALMAFVEGSE